MMLKRAISAADYAGSNQVRVRDTVEQGQLPLAQIALADGGRCALSCDLYLLGGIGQCGRPQGLFRILPKDGPRKCSLDFVAKKVW